MSPESPLGTNRTDSTFTDDAIFHGALRLRQYRRGYRFTEDAVIVGAFASSGGCAATALDLGAGCGVIGLMLLHVGAVERLIAIEVQDSLARLSRRNAFQNGFETSHETLRADLRSMPIRDQEVDLIVSNPPYRPMSAGQLPKDPERAAARHEIYCTPGDLVREAARCLRARGRLVVIYPMERFGEIRNTIESSRLTLCRVRKVTPDQDAPATQVLIEAVRDDHDGPFLEEDPLITHQPDGSRTSEMQHILSGQWQLGE